MVSRIRTGRPIFIALLVLLQPLAVAYSATSAPRSVVERLVKAIASYEPSGAVDSKHNLEVSRLAHKLLGVQQLAQRSLDGQWTKLGKSQRTTFVSLLKRLLEKVAYPKSAEFFKGLELTVDSEEVNGNRARIKTHVVHEDEGEIEIEFVLKRTRGQWVVWDIYLDGVSLATNVKSQIQKVIADESFEGLIKRMRKKLESS